MVGITGLYRRPRARSWWASGAGATSSWGSVHVTYTGTRWTPARSASSPVTSTTAGGSAWLSPPSPSARPYAPSYSRRALVIIANGKT